MPEEKNPENKLDPVKALTNLYQLLAHQYGLKVEEIKITKKGE